MISPCWPVLPPHRHGRCSPSRLYRPGITPPPLRQRAVNPGIDFLPSATPDKRAARRFCRRGLGRANTRTPRVVVTARLGSDPGARRGRKRDRELGRFVRHRRGRRLTKRVEPDHRRVQRRTGPMLGFGSVRTARRTPAGVEAMALLGKGRVRTVPATDLPAPRAFVHRVFGLAA